MTSAENRKRYLRSEVERHFAKGRTLAEIVWWMEEKESVIKPFYLRLVNKTYRTRKVKI